MRRLIITADDFGAAYEVNEAVERAHCRGVLTAASLMVTGAAAQDAIVRARRMPSLRVGLHVVLVEGRPVLPASEVSHLVDASGMFRSDMAMLGAAIFFNSAARRQVAAEIAAQFAAFLATGLPLDHCNAHKHFHLHPVIGGLIADIGMRYGLRAVRVPVEPRRVLRKVEQPTPWTPASLTAPFGLMLRRRLDGAGLLTPDHVFGLQWSGHMTEKRLVGLIRNAPPGLSEIYLHPATGPFVGSAPGYAYRAEMEALLSEAVRTACRDSAASRGGFSDFCGAQTESLSAY